MQIQSVGIDLGKTSFHLVALGAAGKVLVRKKFTEAVASLHREHTDLSDRAGGVLRRPLPRLGAAQAGPRCPVDSSPVREALREVEQERLRRGAGGAYYS